MSQMMSILDEHGNINENQLSKEIKASLEHDIRYRQVDNMKKRAIRTSTNYEEFQAFVACAHLKKLTKKEVESLAQVKQGWKKAPVSKVEKASIIDYERDQEELIKANSQGISIPPKVKDSVSKKKKKVKSLLELERELRRIPDDGDKWRYLQEIGLHPILDLLKGGSEVDFMEEILRVLYVMISEEATRTTVCEWFVAFASIEKFSLFKQFANRQLLANVHQFLLSDPTLVPAETILAFQHSQC